VVKIKAKSNKPAKKADRKKKLNIGKATASTKKVLKKEVNLPLPEAKSKPGKFLSKKRRIRAPKYFRDSWTEVKKVTWPTRKVAFKLSFAVVVFTLVFALFTSIVDYGFSQLVERIFL